MNNINNNFNNKNYNNNNINVNNNNDDHINKKIIKEINYAG